VLSIVAFMFRWSTRCTAVLSLAVSCAVPAFAQQAATAASETQEAAPASSQASSQASSTPSIVLGSSSSIGDSTNSADATQVVDVVEQAAKPTDRRGHFVIVPIPFRNALIGAGLVLGAGYLYLPKGATDNTRHSVAALGGMYAEGGSWAAAAGHRGYWADQRYRTTLGLGTGEIFYDVDLKLQGSDVKIPLRQEFNGATLAGSVRVGSHGWVGGGFVYAQTTVRFDGAPPPPAASADLRAGTEITLANLELSGEWDSRDNDLYPTAGFRAESELSVARQSYGSDDDYETLELQFNGYRAFGERNVLAYRVYGKTVGGDPPFFAMAWYGSGGDLRGYTPGTFISKSLICAQAEWRWKATARWGFVGFAGTGTTSDPIGEAERQWLPSAGVGVRFKILKALNLNMRADYAWGRDDGTFTLAVGEAF
jgi:hypothetical protein